MKKSFYLSFFLILITMICFIDSPSANDKVTIIAGGDIEWSLRVNRPKVIYLKNAKNEKWIKRQWKKVTKKLGLKDDRIFQTPNIINEKSEKYMKDKFGIEIDLPNSHHVSSIKYNLDFKTDEERNRYPFIKIRPIIKEADIAFANLETPLAENARFQRAFCTPPSFAKAIKWAGFDILSTANNHLLDAEGAGLLETHKALSEMDIKYVGSGENLKEARKPVILKKNGIGIAFLGYAHLLKKYMNDYALENRSGVMPLDPLLLEEDIKLIRDKVDFVIVSFHWDTWGGKDIDIHPDAVRLAHFAIDAGADIIFGHHIHLPRGVENYNGKIIFYSFGNLIFGHNHKNWMDNYLARITLSKEKIEKVEIIPISGKGANLAQPYLLKDENASNLLQLIKNSSEDLGTEITIRKNIGIVENHSLL